jgi:transposase
VIHYPAPLTVHLDTPRKTRWLLLQPAEDRDATEQAYVTTRLSLCPQIAQAQALALRFVQLLRERNGAALEGWLVETERSGLIELRAFARGIRRDQEAVEAALRVEWSHDHVAYCTSSLRSRSL